MLKYSFLILLALVACKSQQAITSAVQEGDDVIYIPEESLNGGETLDGEEYTEERLLEEIEVTAPRGFTLPKYNPAATQEWDLLRTELDLRFDWINEHVLARAILTLKPYFYPQQFLMLDAKGMEIQSITDGSGQDLTYQYNGLKIDIDMNQLMTRDQEVELVIDYVAKPSEGPIGGSAAITSDKGLFFINPRGEEGDKPQQIWTQGETENNSRWFPTIDKPNERMTQKISLTVEDRFITLSNGTKVRSVKNPNGMRTDHWEMNDPHAPYLAMIAVGEFAVVKDKWNDVELEYIVEKDYEPYAKQIFDHTPDMLEFFSEILNFPYPWDKYSQIITRDYVSGAMENTTAVIFGDFIQKTDRELIDDDNDYIVAHEMFHHWFGDLVTVESWANLTLQEGFANYSEYLWKEYKEGRDVADHHRKTELEGYLGSVMQGGTHPLIHFGYTDKEDMFDGHSYNKGGLVLHMLRKQIGDEAFYAGLNKYLKDNQYTAVEVDELRMAFEDITGIDLNWFFDQWFHEAGHPDLLLTYEYDVDSKSILLNVIQQQDPENNAAIFILPVTMSVYNEAGVETRFDITLNKREQEVRLEYDGLPGLVVFDTEDKLLYTKTETKTKEEYENQYKWNKTYRHRFEAIEKIKNQRSANATLELALKDPHYTIRDIAVNKIRLKDRPDLVTLVQEMITQDPHSKVRGAAIKKIQKVSGIEMQPIIEQVMDKEQSYKVIGHALSALRKEDNDAALKMAIELKSLDLDQLTTSIGDILSETGDASHLPFFEEKLRTISTFSVFGFYDQYIDLLKTQTANRQLEGAKKLQKISLDPAQDMFYKFAATNAINTLKQGLMSIGNTSDAVTLGEMIEAIKSVETNEILLQRYISY